MSEFNGRSAPNFSEYLQDLNAIPSQYDLANQQQQETFNIDSELSLFTNTEFFDFDKLGDLKIPSFEPVEETEQNASRNSDMEFLDLLGEGFGNVNDFQSPDVNSMNNSTMSTQNNQLSVMPSMPNRLADNHVSPNSSSSTTSPASITSASQPPAPAPASTAVTGSLATGPKRKNTQKTPIMSVEEAARVAAEEDKRRRNTAASARFRVKKKLREQALENTVKETSEKNAALEARVTALELENQWLKNLITEKNGKSAEEGKKAETNITDMFKRFLAAQRANAERSSGESKIGVGTA
ncbi:hypothetical protein P175DRAFT_0108740 [Aspergillus ochraceoroseus IBT 24754]|uniref:BZIP domain-containing protein n=3 Tax=Aspergillus subgen. Nidulantes TaxID=2720870 RepID=A0A0F8XS71_9EURO|nr:uncharacterized protein P175DRAFT_0108740 [Aspergillus ochraceoroseus IBT 24754]KKK15630.1 hypothetical protein AOCH_006956 [Aspergillus ochraceoroseus]KKK26372.1 hypothetical protein ARAM_006649 [Aspergillus rambellii]PTU17375.1 hypothetical protein P175DRAFT_0108740 [Aspergillus ochraceoroseus IBT 24754]